jgi:hypothetical protein
MTIAILRGHDGDEHNTHQNVNHHKSNDDSYSYGIHILT